MKLKLTREGGFIPQTIEKQVDLKDLPQQLHGAIESYANDVQQDQAKTNPLMRDGYKYTLEWSGKNAGKVQFDDTTLPETLREVVDYLLR